MPRCDDVLRPAACIDCHRNGPGTICCADPGGHPFRGFDRRSESRLVTGAVIGAHHAQPEVFDPLALQCEADQASAMACHEVDGVRCRHLSRYDQIAFVLPVLIIDKNEHPAIARFIDDVFDWRDCIGDPTHTKRLFDLNSTPDLKAHPPVQRPPIRESVRFGLPIPSCSLLIPDVSSDWERKIAGARSR